MTKHLLIAGVLLACLSCGAADKAPAAGEAPAAAGSPAAIAPYNTQLFNLVTNKKNIVDGKNYYRKDFDKAFAALLAQSALAKTEDNPVPLKKRLLSGPAPEPEVVKGGGKQYLYYEACQAHACGEKKLGLLYDAASGRMVASLRLDQKQEYLGQPVPAEKQLLDQLQARN